MSPPPLTLVRPVSVAFQPIQMAAWDDDGRTLWVTETVLIGCSAQQISPTTENEKLTMPALAACYWTCSRLEVAVVRVKVVIKQSFAF